MQALASLLEDNAEWAVVNMGSFQEEGEDLQEGTIGSFIIDINRRPSSFRMSMMMPILLVILGWTDDRSGWTAKEAKAHMAKEIKLEKAEREREQRAASQTDFMLAQFVQLERRNREASQCQQKQPKAKRRISQVSLFVGNPVTGK